MDSTLPPSFLNADYQCFFDNIVFAPFIFIEDPDDIDSSPGLNTDLTGSVSTTTSLPSAGLTTPFRTNKVDPYYLIMNVGGIYFRGISLTFFLLGPARSTQGWCWFLYPSEESFHIWRDKWTMGRRMPSQHFPEHPVNQRWTSIDSPFICNIQFILGCACNFTWRLSIIPGHIPFEGYKGRSSQQEGWSRGRW